MSAKFTNKIKIQLYLFLLMFCLTLSCDKEGLVREFGKYAIAISYEGEEVIELHFVMDGEELATMVPASGVSPSFMKDCSKLGDTEQLINVITFDKITRGRHKLEIKTSGAKLIKTLEFEMFNGECIIQDTKIALA